jgi:hypothetical protein
MAGIKSMTVEQIVVLIYTALGVGGGLISNFFTSAASPYKTLVAALLVPLAVYFTSLALLLRTVQQKKKRWLVYNSFMTFALVWLVVWIFLFNIM